MLSAGRRDDDSYGEIPAPRPAQSAGQPAGQPYKQAASPYQGGDVGSLRDDINFEEDFPLDFSELSDSQDGSGEVDVPF
jgi:hypothetical protein